MLYTEGGVGIEDVLVAIMLGVAGSVVSGDGRVGVDGIEDGGEGGVLALELEHGVFSVGPCGGAVYDAGVFHIKLGEFVDDGGAFYFDRVRVFSFRRFAVRRASVASDTARSDVKINMDDFINTMSARVSVVLTDKILVAERSVVVFELAVGDRLKYLRSFGLLGLEPERVFSQAVGFESLLFLEALFFKGYWR